MKVRDSGMPELTFWESFFDATTLLNALLPPTHWQGSGAEIGCGYGTFTLAAAQQTTGWLHAFDIDPQMIDTAQQRTQAQGLARIQWHLCDVLQQGTGLGENQLSYVLIFNLLHTAHPMRLISEAQRVLEPGGVLALVHWRSDIPTPRGPALDIRPKPQQMQQWLAQSGFVGIAQHAFDERNPYHYGVTGLKPQPRKEKWGT